MQDTKTKAKSVKLTPAEQKKLKLRVSGFTTQEAAAIYFGVGNRITLARILGMGSGSEDNITGIRSKLNVMS